MRALKGKIIYKGLCNKSAIKSVHHLLGSNAITKCVHFKQCTPLYINLCENKGCCKSENKRTKAAELHLWFLINKYVVWTSYFPFNWSTIVIHVKMDFQLGKKDYLGTEQLSQGNTALLHSVL